MDAYGRNFCEHIVILSVVLLMCTRKECRFTDKRTEKPEIEVFPEKPEEKADAEESAPVMPGMMPMPGMLPNMMMPGMGMAGMMPGMMMPMLPTMMPAMPMMPMMAGMMPMAMSMAGQAAEASDEARPARSRSRSRGWDPWPEIPDYLSPCLPRFEFKLRPLRPGLKQRTAKPVETNRSVPVTIIHSHSQRVIFISQCSNKHLKHSETVALLKHANIDMPAAEWLCRAWLQVTIQCFVKKRSSFRNYWFCWCCVGQVVCNAVHVWGTWMCSERAWSMCQCWWKDDLC